MVDGDAEGAGTGPRGSGRLWYLGFGLYWTWVYLSFNSQQITSQTFNGGAFIPILHVVSGFIGCGAFALAAILHRRIGASRHLGTGLWMMAALTAFGSLFYAVPISGDSVVTMMTGAVITGFASVWVALAWGELFSKLDVRSAAMLTAGSFLLAGALYLVIAWVPQPISGFTVTFLPPLSVFCLYMADPRRFLFPVSPATGVGPGQVKGGTLPEPATAASVDTGTERICGAGPRRFFSQAFPAKVVIGIFMAMFVCGGLRIWSSSFGTGVYDDPLLVGVPTAGAALVFLVYSFFLSRKSLNLGPLYRMALPLLAIASVLLAVFGTSNAHTSYLIVQASASLMDMLTWVLLIEIARTTHYPPLLVFAVGRFVIHAGMAIGELVGLTQVGSMYAFLIVSIVILVVVAGFTFTDRDMTFFVEPPTEEELTERLDGREELDAHIRSIGAANGLSPRETDVFLLWATGHGMKAIQEKLVLSPATVKTHLRHIYEKCDVHSRAEILELIERSR